MFKKLFGDKSACSKCGKFLRETRKRKPCPKCGGMNRILSRETFEQLGAVDKAS